MADALHYVLLEDGYDEYEMLSGDPGRSEGLCLPFHAKDGEGTGYTDLDDDEIDVVWEMESERMKRCCGRFHPAGTAALPLPFWSPEGRVPKKMPRALWSEPVFYLKGTGEEIGSEEI